jgi:nicotinamide-nucleotide amidase
MIELLTIGDELLSGRTADTNAHFIARALTEAGLSATRFSSVGDGLEDIRRALTNVLPDTRFVIATGGLGPTDDDLTAPAAAATFGLELAVSQAAVDNMERRYREFGRPMPEAAKKQAVLPEGCEPIENPVGTACGFLIKDGQRQFFFLPGVPEEVHAMTGAIIERIRSKCGMCRIIKSRTLKVFGLWESKIQELLKGRLPELPAVALGFYPAFPEVSLKITATGTDEQHIEHELQLFQGAIQTCIGEYIYSENNELLEEVVGRLLAAGKATVAVAESCTGGLITHRLTNIPGSSRYVERSFVVYSNMAKQELLGVPEAVLAEHGAVSEPVARLMAEGARGAAGTTYGLSVTGIAGPDGGTPEKPVGTVFIGIATPEETLAKKIFYPGSREKVKMMTAQMALNLLRLVLLGSAPGAGRKKN